MEHVKGRAPEGAAERGGGAGGRRVGEGAACGESEGRRGSEDFFLACVRSVNGYTVDFGSDAVK